MFAVLCACLPLRAPAADVEPPPAPPASASLRTFDHASDDGFTINLSWGRAEGEAPDVYYIVEIANDADYRAGTFRRVARLPSLKALKSDEKRFHDYHAPEVNARNKELHYLGVIPSEFYPPPGTAGGPSDTAGLRPEAKPRQFYFRLAIVRVAKTTEKRKEKRPVKPKPRKPKEEEEPPVLARARELHTQFLSQLDALHAFLTRLDESLKAEERPRLAKASYLGALSAVDNQTLAASILHARYLDALQELDEAVAAGRDPKQELADWEKRKREADEEARAAQAADAAKQPQLEEVEIEVKKEQEGEPAYVTEGGKPKAIAARASLPPLVRPDAAGLRACDLRSDDGKTIAVEWPRSPSENARTRYAVEIAEVTDGRPGDFKQAAVLPSLGAEKLDHPKHFGFRTRNRSVHLATIQPSRFFPTDRKALREALRKETVEAELEWMPKDFAPDADFARHVAAFAVGLATYRERVRALPPSLETLEGPFASPLEGLAPSLLSAVSDYGAYAAKLKRFESYVARQIAKRTKERMTEVSRQTYAFRVSIGRYGEHLALGTADGPHVVEASARPDYFKGFKLNNLIFSIVFCSIVAAFIHLARRNPNLFIRKIAGLDAVEEAIGRATEMGRSVFFVHGLTGMGSLSTIAAVNILGRVARRAAEYDTRVRVMNRDPIVMAVSQEVVKQSYTEAGRPDAYNDDDVALVASDQFSYVAAVGGRMLRERPAAIFLMGYFYAESLLLSETGASTGAIQIAGTDSYTQIPFFVTTCDYTLIGEELYAASAYLSREPRMLGSLRGQDIGKAFLMAGIVLFALLATVGKLADWDLWWIQSLFQPF